MHWNAHSGNRSLHPFDTDVPSQTRGSTPRCFRVLTCPSLATQPCFSTNKNTSRRGVARKACRVAGRKPNVATCVVTYTVTMVLSEERTVHSLI